MDDQKIKKIQKKLIEAGADGWLLYDCHGSNRFAHQLLDIEPGKVLTRRFFYWIPKEGEPEILLHQIEADSIKRPGRQSLYLSWAELQEKIRNMLQGTKKILMEYSPMGANPHISIVDAGTLEMIRAARVEVVSSADLLQCFTSVLTEEQIATHKEAAHVIEETLLKAWDLIADRVRKNKKISEQDVQNFILSEFAAHDCVTEEGPICAVNEHTAMPHYTAIKESSKLIERGDFILIDLWCKKDLPHAIYADVTQVAIAASEPTPKQQAIFDIVKTAQQNTIDFIKRKIEANEPIQGAEVDELCRSYIQSQGYGKYFTHRTGHNLDTAVHGAGVNFDNLETSDHRLLLPQMCFTVEPGIYLPGDFGIRLETNLLIQGDQTVEITPGVENSLICLL